MSAALTELISRIDDKALRERILQETDRTIKNKKVGLVFEYHRINGTVLIMHQE